MNREISGEISNTGKFVIEVFVCYVIILLLLFIIILLLPYCYCYVVVVNNIIIIIINGGPPRGPPRPRLPPSQSVPHTAPLGSAAPRLGGPLGLASRAGPPLTTPDN